MSMIWLNADSTLVLSSLAWVCPRQGPSDRKRQQTSVEGNGLNDADSDMLVNGPTCDADKPTHRWPMEL
jgi:hypothetical protein